MRRGRIASAVVIARSGATKQSTNSWIVSPCLRKGRNDMSRKMSLPPFHLAFPVDDLAAARHFYGELLGCPEGRSADHWVDFDLHGHQIVAHLAPRQVQARSTNPVDGEDVPVPHFGLVLDRSSWDSLAKRLTDAEVQFV